MTAPLGLGVKGFSVLHPSPDGPPPSPPHARLFSTHTLHFYFLFLDFCFLHSLRVGWRNMCEFPWFCDNRQFHLGWESRRRVGDMSAPQPKVGTFGRQAPDKPTQIRSRHIFFVSGIADFLQIFSKYQSTSVNQKMFSLKLISVEKFLLDLAYN